MSVVDTESAGGLLSPEHRRLSVAIYTAIGLIAFEGTSVAAALPELAADLGNVGRLPWVITAFLFALGVSTVVSGSLVDALGASRLFGWAAGSFALSGFVAGLAPTLDALIAIRLVQGATSGVLFAAVIAGVNLGFPEHLTGRAFAANSTVWGVMGASAPAIAALMLNVASWRWIFFINLPLGALALVAGLGVMPGRQEGAEPLSIDRRGALLTMLFTLFTIVAVDQLGPRSAVFGALAVASLIAYGWHGRRVERPLINPELLSSQPYLGLALVPSFILAAAFSVNIYITVYVAAGREVANGTAAWSVIFFTVGWTVGANASSLVLDRTAPVNVMLGGYVITTSALVMVAVGVVANAALMIVFAGLLLTGIGIGLTTNASLIMLRARTALTQIGRASAANQFSRSQGFTLGSAAGGSVLLFVVGRRLGSVEPVRRLLAGEPVADGQSAAEVSEAVRGGFGVVAIIAVVLALCAVPAMVSLFRFARAQPVPVNAPARAV